MDVNQVVEKQYGTMHNRGYIDALKAFTRQTFHDTEASHLPRPIRALCLGLGTLSNSDYNPTRSASQFAAFQAFLEVLTIPPEDVRMHDPNFSEEDKAYLTSLGYGLPKDAEDAKQDLICTVPTLVFAPYLPYPVFELIFARNWSQERLRNIVIIGTALEGWLDDDNWFRGQSKAFIPRMRKSIPLFDVLDLPKMSKSAEEEQAHHRRFAVEGLKLQWIPPRRLESLGERFWHIRKMEESTWPNPEAEARQERKAASKL